MKHFMTFFDSRKRSRNVISNGFATGKNLCSLVGKKLSQLSRHIVKTERKTGSTSVITETDWRHFPFPVTFSDP